MKRTTAALAMAIVMSFAPSAAQADSDYGVRPKFRISQACSYTDIMVKPSRKYDFVVERNPQRGYATADFWVKPGYYFEDAVKVGRYEVSESGQSAHVFVEIKDC